jgi:nucleoside-diphosphate-sugar epimerase
MAGTECLIHSAALVYSGAPWPEIRSVNVEATRAAMGAAALAGISRAVHVSSIAVYGTGLRLADEETPLDSPLSPPNLYARSKREAERVAGEVAVEAGMKLTVVRPSAVYGERDRLFAPRLSRVVKLPWIPILGSGGNRVPVVYAGNVARGILLALRHAGPERVFNLSQDDPVTQKELLAAFAEGFGRAPRFVSVPAGLIRGAAKVTSRLGASVPGMQGLPLERVAQYGLEHNPYPSRRAHEVLGWTEHTGHAEALRRTAEWLSDYDRN